MDHHCRILLHCHPAPGQPALLPPPLPAPLPSPNPSPGREGCWEPDPRGEGLDWPTRSSYRPLTPGAAWLNNCVGHYNHRYFFSFCLFMTMGCIYCSISAWDMFRDAYAAIEVSGQPQPLLCPSRRSASVHRGCLGPPG